MRNLKKMYKYNQKIDLIFEFENFIYSYIYILIQI